MEIMNNCSISELMIGTKIKCADKWHGVVLFNNTCKYHGEYESDYWKSLGDGFMANYDEVGLVFQNDTSEIEIM